MPNGIMVQKKIVDSIYYELEKSKKLFDEINITPAMQMIEESRHNRVWQSASKTSRIEKVNVYSINADLQKR